MCFAEVGLLAPMFKKKTKKKKKQLQNQLKSKPKLPRSKNKVHIATLNMRTLNGIGQLPVLIVSAAEYNINM